MPFSLTPSRISLGHIVLLLLVLGLVLVSVPIVVHPDPVPSSGLNRFLAFLEKVGDAVLIAAILAGLVERAMSYEHFRELVQYISVEVFGDLLPDRLREHIRGYFRMDFVRTPWDIVYTIQPWPDKTDYLQLHISSRFYMQNRTNAAKPYPFQYSVEESVWPDAPTQITSVRADNMNYKGPALEAMVTSAKGYQVLKFERELKLDPYDGPGNPTYEFRAESIQSFKDFVVSTFWALYPVLDATFTVYYPAGFDVQFETTFDDSGKPRPVDRTDKQLQGLKWEIEGPILPGQGFFVRCTKTPPAQPGTALKSAN